MGILRKIIAALVFAGVVLSQTKVCGIAVFDNEELADWKLKKLIRTQEAPWYHKLVGKRPSFKPRQLEKDLKIIEDYYRSAGYLDVKVNANAHLEGDCAYINIFIEEGGRYTLKSAEIIGEVSPHISSAELLSRLDSKIGRPVDPKMLQADARKLRRFIQELGYPYATAEMSFEKADSTVDAKFAVDFGRYAYFGETTISGLALTVPPVVERELEIERGAPYDISKVTSSRESLYGTGLFSAVVIEPAEAANPETLDYNITLIERSPRWTGLSIGTGNDGVYDFVSQFGAEWGHRNLFGTGRELSLQLSSDWRLDTEQKRFSDIITSWSNLNNRIEFRYTEPYIFKRKIPVTLNPYYEPANSTKIPQYTIQLVGVNLSGSYKPTTQLSHTVYMVFEIAGIYDVIDPEAQEAIFENEGQYFTRSIGYSLVKDKRDNIFVPTEGGYTLAQTEMAGYFFGGDKHYTKLVLDFRRYISLRERYIIAMRAKSSVLGNWRKDEYVLIHDRFFMGGANSVRGWRERSIGPISSVGEPVGGKLSMLGNLELRAPLVWQLWGHLFMDAGNVWDHAEAFGIGDFRVGAGWGLAIITPVGPVRFDYGYQIANKSVSGPNSNWHLALMYSF